MTQTLQNDLMEFLSSYLVPGMWGQIIGPEKLLRVRSRISIKSDFFFTLEL